MSHLPKKHLDFPVGDRSVRRSWLNLEATRYVWEYSKQKGSALVVMLALAKHADKNFEAWPSCQTIANLTKMSRRYVVKILEKLKKAGEIIGVRTTKNGVVVYKIICGPMFTDQNESSVNTKSLTTNGSSEHQFISNREPQCTAPMNPVSHKYNKNIESEKTAGVDVEQPTNDPASTHWHESRPAMEKAFGKEVFESWMSSVTVETDNGKAITLVVPTRLFRDQITDNYLPEMERILDRKVRIIVQSL